MKEDNAKNKNKEKFNENPPPFPDNADNNKSINFHSKDNNKKNDKKLY